jgi:hypothetical protein
MVVVVDDDKNLVNLSKIIIKMIIPIEWLEQKIFYFLYSWYISFFETIFFFFVIIFIKYKQT